MFLLSYHFVKWPTFFLRRKKKQLKLDFKCLANTDSMKMGTGGGNHFPTKTTRGMKKSVSFKKMVSLVKEKFLLQAGISPAEGFIGMITLKFLTVSSAVIHWDFVRQGNTVVLLLLNTEGCLSKGY